MKQPRKQKTRRLKGKGNGIIAETQELEPAEMMKAVGVSDQKSVP